jgi:hypothetical protein
MYDQRPGNWDDLVAPFPEQVQTTALWLRNLICEAVPGLDEGLHGGTKVAMALYGVGGQERIALGIQPGPRSVKLYIHDPEHLPPSTFRLEGSGRHMRHIKFKAPDEQRRDELLRLIRVPVERRS